MRCSKKVRKRKRRRKNYKNCFFNEKRRRKQHGGEHGPNIIKIYRQPCGMENDRGVKRSVRRLILLPPFQEINISSKTTFEACERQGAGWLFLN